MHRSFTDQLIDAEESFGYHGDPDDPYDNSGHYQAVGGPIVLAHPHGTPPDEFGQQEELGLSDYGCDPALEAAKVALAAKGQARHIEMANQMLPWKYGNLTVEEIANLVSVCNERFRKLISQNVWTQDEALEAETIALVQTALWTGSSLERAVDLQIITSPNPDAELALYAPEAKLNEHRICEWRVRSHFPEYATHISLSDEDKLLLRPRGRFVYLPDILGVSRYLVPLKERERNRKGNRLFRRELDVYRRSLKALLKSVPNGRRITEHKITRLVFNRIQESSGHIVYAVALTGRPHPLANVRMFYSTPRIETLRRYYISAVDKLATQVYSAIDKPKPAPYLAPKPIHDLSVGSRLCPSYAAVKTAVARMQKRIAALGSYNCRVSFARYHNLYTLYTIQMIGYASGYRAVVSPFIPSSQIDRESGLATLSDKDDQENSKTRLIWLPPAVIEQILAYERHVRAIFESVDAPLGPNSDVLFIDERRFVAREVRPKTVEVYLSEFLPVQANTHRRFMRTELAERGCPPEVIDAWMGHWSRGEEPWGPYSSFCVEQYVASLQQYLLPLLEGLGWRLVQSEVGING